MQAIHSASAASTDATALFSWKTVQPAPLARFEAQGAVVNGKLYVIGGFYIRKFRPQTMSTSMIWTATPGSGSPISPRRSLTLLCG
jgi:hypothetical protein